MPPAEFQKRLDLWRNGALVQDAFRGLSADDREFIMTGTTPEEFDNAFAED